MKLIKQSIERLEATDYKRQIELCGRVCYKSEAKIAQGTADTFVAMLIKRGHTAMLEHGTIYLQVTATHSNYDDCVQRYSSNKYSTVVKSYTTGYSHNKGLHSVECACITTNYRVIIENNWVRDLAFIVNPQIKHARRVTFRFICSRQVSHQLVRHRVFSFAQESTQYCNYSLGKFGNEITFIEPTWYASANWFIKLIFKCYLHICEWLYMLLIKAFKKPHLAATVLPNATKTELCMTGFITDWRNFINLRKQDDNISQTYELIRELSNNNKYLFL